MKTSQDVNDVEIDRQTRWSIAAKYQRIFLFRADLSWGRGGGGNAAKLFYGFPLRSDIESGWMFQSFRPASLQMHLSTIISWFSFSRNLCSVFHFDWFLFQYDPCYSFARWILVANKWSNPSWKGTAYLTFNCDWSIIIKERQREK